MAAAPLLICASSRPGNSLEAAHIFAEGFGSCLKPTLLSGYNVLPCVGCGACGKGQSCPLLESDTSRPLLEAFLQAPSIAIASPVYFYHLPAQLKALIDRCQQYYAWRESGIGGLDRLPRRKAFIMLAAAREKGEQLFTGSLLSLKLAMSIFNIELEKPVLMHGLDGPGDLARHPDYRAALLAYGARAAGFMSKQET